MNELLVKIGKSEIKINRGVFLSLLDVSPVKAYVAYKHAINSGAITFSDLKALAAKADVPYPLFFAPVAKVTEQIKDKSKNLFEKLPSKGEMRLAGRGSFFVEDVELIVRDLGRKQEFLKKRVLTGAHKNSFVGYLAKKAKSPHTNRELAEDIRKYLGIDLSVLRERSKAGVVEYLRDCAERKNILISFSSHNFMPQNLDPELGLSGLCVKDQKFPIIFVNTRDGDEKPKILESDGRQVFTLIAMLVCIALNRFVFSTRTKNQADPLTNKVFSIVGEFLIPLEDIANLEIKNLEELKKESTKFKVTPSMLLVRLQECKLIARKLAKHLREELIEEIKRAAPGQKKPPLLTTGYGKYNGTKLSRTVLDAFRKKTISHDEMRNILFRKGKMDQNLVKDYTEKFK